LVEQVILVCIKAETRVIPFKCTYQQDGVESKGKNEKREKKEGMGKIRDSNKRARKQSS
jgi:hypothetical protein